MSGADLEYRAMLARAGVNPVKSQGYDGARLEQINDNNIVPLALNALDYGVDNTGIKSTSSSLQNFIDSNTGKPLYLPPGTYLCDVPLKIPSNTYLYGTYSSKIKFTWVLASQGESYITNYNNFTGDSNITIRNITVEGAGDGLPYGDDTSPASGILFKSVSDVNIFNIVATLIPGPAIAHQGAARIKILGCTIYRCGRGGIGFWGFTNFIRTMDIVIADNNIDIIGDDAIAVQFSVPNALYYPSPSNIPTRIVISNNTIFGWETSGLYDNAGRGIFIRGVTNVAINNNTIENTSSSGISVVSFIPAGMDSSNINITNNVMKNIGDPLSVQVRSAIYITGANLIGISNNIIDSSQEHGIILILASYVKITGNIIKNCGTLISGHHGIYISGTSSGVRDVSVILISDNIIDNNAANGIRAVFCELLQIINNTVLNNGRLGDSASSSNAGIYIDTLGSVVINNNVCQDNQGSKKQSTGIYNVSACSSLSCSNNNCLNNAVTGMTLGSPTFLIKRGNFESTVIRNNFDTDYSGLRRYSAPGSPEGVVTAPVGCVYQRTDGAAGTSFYVKETGTGNTGWVAK